VAFSVICRHASRVAAFVSLDRDTPDLGLTSWQGFAKLFKARSESGRGASPDSFFLFQTCSRRINHRATGKGLFYENEKFTHKKFDKPRACTTRFHRNGAEYFCDTIPGYSF
jgi:hypothetical protein